VAQEWYYSTDGKAQGPLSLAELRDLAEGGRLLPDDLVWKDGMAEWAPADTVPGLFEEHPPPPPRRRRRRDEYEDDDRGRPRRSRRDPEVEDAAGKKVAAGICAILVGCFGVHKFILGLTTPGLVMLLVSILTCGVGALPMSVIALVEGVIYLTKGDVDFYETYIVEKKGWF
jgi:TM2 domain-containing membrane protein YozV